MSAMDFDPDSLRRAFIRKARSRRKRARKEAEREPTVGAGKQPDAAGEDRTESLDEKFARDIFHRYGEIE